MVRYYADADTPQPPRQATPATPPQEGNCLVQNTNMTAKRIHYKMHRPDTPPQEGNGSLLPMVSTTIEVYCNKQHYPFAILFWRLSLDVQN